MRSERGSVLIQVAVGLIGLMAFTTFVFDYGVLWTGRRMAQNSADAAALAGAVSLAFDNYDDRSDTGPAKTTAFRVSQDNQVWSQAPKVNITSDIFFPACPDDGSNACIRVNVFRNAASGNPLPVFFGPLVGLTQQGVQAMAIAKAAAANGSNCLKPWAIPDKWLDVHDVTPPIDKAWTADDTFDTQDGNGNPLANPDIYERPMPGNPGTPGTGFTQADYGVQLTLKFDSNKETLSPGFFNPVVLTDPGAATYSAHIAGCPGNNVRINDGTGCPGGLVDPTKGCINKEPGAKIGPTTQGFEELYKRDPYAKWDSVAEQVVGGCEASGNCDTSSGLSPRKVPIAVYDTGAYYASKMSGRADPLIVVNIIGFFIDFIQGNGQKIDIIGYLIPMPGEWKGGPTNRSNTFTYSIHLVR